MKKLNSLSNHKKYVYAYSALIRILDIDAFSEDKKEFVRNMILMHFQKIRKSLSAI